MSYIRFTPTGARGPTGSIGPAGISPTGFSPIGIQGPTGNMGPTGFIGPAGMDAPTAPYGVTGPMGPTGFIGITGEIGPTGYIGITGFPGLTGLKGPTGLRGPTGNIGPTGFIGPTGKIGATGTYGLTGAIGPTGYVGITGTFGSTGNIGPTGYAGIAGVQGPTGMIGPTGFTGPTGFSGLSANPMFGISGLRLSLATGSSLTTTDLTNQSTLFLVPHKSGQILLYNGSSWDSLVTGVISLALSSLTSGANYDVFAYNNTGTVTLELVVWSSDTARATDLVTQDGIYVKSGDATRLYVGTLRTTSTSATEDSAAKRFLWNYYNQEPRTLVFTTTSNWTYSGTWRQANNTSASAVFYVSGTIIEAEATVMSSIKDATSLAAVGVGIDSTTTNSAKIFGAYAKTNVTQQAYAFYQGYPGIGYHAINWLEQAVGTITYGGGANITAGIVGMIFG